MAVPVASFCMRGAPSAFAMHHPSQGYQGMTPCSATSTQAFSLAVDSDMMEVTSSQINPKLCLELVGRSAKDIIESLEVVSLGSYCGAKVTLRRMGLSEASLPFDWIRTRAAGLIHWLQNDFDDFFNVDRRLEVEFDHHDGQMLVFRSSMHSFWHDNIDDEAVREKLQRRVDRFMNLSNVADPQRPILFVRSVAGTAEIELTETLYELLQEHFGQNGRRVYLLLIIEDQSMTGPILHEEYDGILFWVQPRFDGELSLIGNSPTPYENAVAFAISRVFGETRGIEPGFHPGDAHTGEFPSVSHSTEILLNGGPFQEECTKHSNCGIWDSQHFLKGVKHKVKLAAFEGYDDVKVGYLGDSQQQHDYEANWDLQLHEFNEPLKEKDNYPSFMCNFFSCLGPSQLHCKNRCAASVKVHSVFVDDEEESMDLSYRSAADACAADEFSWAGDDDDDDHHDNGEQVSIGPFPGPPRRV